MPDRDFAVFKFAKFAKFAKETGDTWEINTCKSTTCQMIGRQPGSLDDVRPGEVNDQRIVNSWHHIMDEGQ